MTQTLLVVPIPDSVKVESVPLSWIRPSSLNPRRFYDGVALEELAESLRELGMIEPIVVREVDLGVPMGSLAHLEIVAGERRYRAARLVSDMITVPVRNVGPIDDATALRIALVENLQRSDLNPIEEAEGYARLNRVAGLKQAEIAAAVHRSQPTIANRLRLLDLPEDVQQMIRVGTLTASHGIALATHKDYPHIASAIAKHAVANKLTSARLEQDPSGDVIDVLTKANFIRSPSAYETSFDALVCKTCPFGAYRPTWGYRPVCLNPAHFDELQAAAVAERAQQDAARLARQREREATGMAMTPTVKLLDRSIELETTDAEVVDEDLTARAAMAATADVPRRRDLAYGTFEDVGRSPPTGCTEDCPCRSYCREFDGGPLHPVCLDPGQFRRLKRRETVAANKARRAHAKALAERVSSTLDAIETIGPAELTVLVKQALQVVIRQDRVESSWLDLNGIKDAITRAEHGLGVVDLYNRATATLGAEVEIVRHAVGAILGGEIALYHEGYFGNPDPDLTLWYLATKGASVDVAGIVETAQADAAAEETDEPLRMCEMCDDPETAHKPLVPYTDENEQEYLICASCRREIDRRDDADGEDDVADGEDDVAEETAG